LPAISNPGGPNTIWQQTSNGHLYRGINDLETVVTLQDAYDNSVVQEIVLNNTNNGISIRDNLSSINSNLFEIQNNAGSITYFNVHPSNGTTIDNKLTVTGLMNSAGLEFTPVISNPGGISGNTIWQDSLNSNILTLDTRPIITGPAISTANAIAKYDNVTGNSLINTNIIIDNFNNLSEINNLSCLQINTNNIDEFTFNNGVNIDSVNIKDGTLNLLTTTSNPGGPNTIWQQTSNGHLFRGPIDLENPISLQSVYNNSINPEIILNTINNGITIRDNSSSINNNLFEIQNNTDTITYFSVHPSNGTIIDGKLTVTELIDQIGLEFTPITANPGGIIANTIWQDSLNSDRLTFNTNPIVTGPTTSTVNAIATFSTTNGNQLHESTFLDLLNDYIFTNVNTPTHTALSTEQVIGVLYTISGTCIITLPYANNKKMFKIIDIGGNAYLNNIEIKTQIGDNILGNSSFFIVDNYNSVNVINDGVNSWYIA
jgi:hypothetical protein